MKKNLIGLFLVIVTGCLMCGCDKDDKEKAPDFPQIVVETVAEGGSNSEMETDGRNPEFTKVGENKVDSQNDYCSMKIIKMSIGKDLDGNLVAMLYVNFANRDDIPTSFEDSFSIDLMQNTVELEKDNKMAELPKELGNESKKIERGDSIDCCYIYKLKDRYNPVIISLKDNRWGFGEIGRSEEIDVNWDNW